MKADPMKTIDRSSPAAYVPEAGSLTARVLDFMCRNMEEDVLTRDLTSKFDVTTSVLTPALQEPQRLHLLTYERQTGVWRAGPGLAAWKTQRDAPANIIAPQRRKLVYAPRAASTLDPSKLVIKSGVPVPSKRAPGVKSAYAVLWQRMQTGDSVELPDRQAHGLASYVKGIKGIAVVRRVSEGVKGVWRTA